MICVINYIIAEHLLIIKADTDRRWVSSAPFSPGGGAVKGSVEEVVAFV